MRRYLFSSYCLYLLLLCLPTKNQAAEQSFYYLITDKQHEFILAPSLHSDLPSRLPTALTKQLSMALMKDKTLCLEGDIELVKKSSTQPGMARDAYYNPRYKVSDYLRPEDVAIYVNYLNKKLQLDLNNQAQEKALFFDTMTPFGFMELIIYIYDLNLKVANKSNLENFFKQYSQLIHKPVEYVETIDDFFPFVIHGLANKVSWRDALAKLAQLIQCEDCFNRYQQLNIEIPQAIFFQANLSKAQALHDELMELSGRTEVFDRQIIDLRSLNLARLIEKKFQEKKCSLFLIGAAHFWGEHALPKEFEKLGYQTRRIDLADD